MKLTCPHCEHSVNVKTPAPGEYRLRCQQCAQIYLATVPEEQQPLVQSRALASPTAVKPQPQRAVRDSQAVNKASPAPAQRKPPKPAAPAGTKSSAASSFS